MSATRLPAVVDPHTGEALDVRDVDRVAEAVLAIRELRDRAALLLRDATAAVEELSALEGTRTWRTGRWKLELVGGDDHEWDINILSRLLAAGLPEDRYNALVKQTVSYTVDLREARRIAAANPDYERIISMAHTVRPKQARLKVGRA